MYIMIIYNIVVTNNICRIVFTYKYGTVMIVDDPQYHIFTAD